ncbi:MAG: alpha-ketoglutarate-dependent dioxygenase AlkB [Snowella sp.]|nr:alpha-ketoglutarate-dependent dioxygenase AlkB [Snowella sp.]
MFNSSKLLAEQLLPHNGNALLYRSFFNSTDADNYLSTLTHDISWKHESIKLFGKFILQPRLTAYYGDKNYPYSGISMQSQPWTLTLLEIKAKIEEISSFNFNAVLLNLYRDGNDSIGWHSDDERELADGSVIASLSLGETRRFMFRNRNDHAQKIERQLNHGDLLIMRDMT